MDSIVTPIALIVAGIIAASAFIISKAPNAKQLIDKIAPIQGVLGIGLLVWGIVDLIRVLPHIEALNKSAEESMFRVVAVYAALASELLLGFLLGMPLIAKLIPGDSPIEQRAVEMQKKIGAYQTILGFVGIGAAIALLYYRFK